MLIRLVTMEMVSGCNLCSCMRCVCISYYCLDGGDKDARDLRAMKVEGRLREGKGSDGIGVFEKHTSVCEYTVPSSAWQVDILIPDCSFHACRV